MNNTNITNITKITLNEPVHAEKAFSNYDDYAAHTVYIEQQQKLLDVRRNNLIKDFFQALQNADVPKIKEMVAWGIDKFGELYEKHNGEFTFKRNSSLCVNASSSKFSEEIRDYLLLEASDNIKRASVNFFLRSLDKQILGNSYSSQSFIAHNTLDDIEWLIEKMPSEFKKYEPYLVNNWGNIPFDLDKHQKIHNIVMERIKNSPEKIVDVFCKASSQRSHATILPQNTIPSIEKLYAMPFYQEQIDKLPRHIMLNVGQKNLENAIGLGNKESINFWASFYIPFPESKKCYSSLAQSCHTHSDFFDVLGFVLDNVDITLHGHLFLRAALQNNHRDTVDFLFTRYNKNQLLEIKDLLNEKKYQHFHESYQNNLNKMIIYKDFEEMPEKDTITKKHKL
jgi:hypothetical protein